MAVPEKTCASVPGFRRIIGEIELGELHPWPWLCRPIGRSIASFSAWRKANDKV